MALLRSADMEEIQRVQTKMKRLDQVLSASECCCGFWSYLAESIKLFSILPIVYSIRFRRKVHAAYSVEISFFRLRLTSGRFRLRCWRARRPWATKLRWRCSDSFGETGNKDDKFTLPRDYQRDVWWICECAELGRTLQERMNESNLMCNSPVFNRSPRRICEELWSWIHLAKLPRSRPRNKTVIPWFLYSCL